MNHIQALILLAPRFESVEGLALEMVVVLSFRDSLEVTSGAD